MKAKEQILIALFSAFVFSSCEQDVNLDLPQPEPKVVVEGIIEQEQYPTVLLTRNQAYFSPVDTATILNTVISDAIVIVDDGITFDTLTFTADLTYFPPTLYKGTKLKGELGKTYNLTVYADGKTITSTTSIPDTVSIDSLWFKTQPPSQELGFIWANFTEPVGLGNNYRWMAKRLGKDLRFIAPMGSVFEDKFIDGKNFDFAYNRGVEFNSTAEDDNNEERGYFKKGDTIVVKFCSITRRSFDFFRSFETEVSNNGNPFASPSTIKSNVEGGIGHWGGYGAVYDTIIAN